MFFIISCAINSNNFVNIVIEGYNWNREWVPFTVWGFIIDT